MADEAPGEWEFLTFDLEADCPVCGAPIRAGQAAGYVEGRAVHARCTPPSVLARARSDKNQGAR